MKRAAALVALSLVITLAATGCSGDDGPSIVVYNAQHEQLLEEIAPAFTDKTGIKVELRNGDDAELVRAAGPGGRRLAGRRVPDRELPGDVRGREAPACSRRSRRGARPDPGAVPSRERPVDRLRRALDRPRLQHQHGDRGRPARSRSWTSPTPSTPG